MHYMKDLVKIYLKKLEDALPFGSFTSFKGICDICIIGSKRQWYYGFRRTVTFVDNLYKRVEDTLHERFS